MIISDTNILYLYSQSVMIEKQKGTSAKELLTRNQSRNTTLPFWLWVVFLFRKISFERGHNHGYHGLCSIILRKNNQYAQPSGYTGEVMKMVEEEAGRLGFASAYNRKGGRGIEAPGRETGVLGLSAHVDTLGAMVRSISPKGALSFVPVGGFMMESIEGMYCKIHTRQGKAYTGTILTREPSVHTYDDARTLERKVKNMEVRLDEAVEREEDVKALGICPGDYISFDPMYVHTESGFIKSRHLDDKASVAVLMGVLRDISQSGKKQRQTLKILISNYEEVGFGASCIPGDIEEFLAVDMGAVGMT